MGGIGSRSTSKTTAVGVVVAAAADELVLEAGAAAVAGGLLLVLVVADALLCDKEGNWAMNSTIPFPKNIELQIEGKNTEGRLLTEKLNSLVLLCTCLNGGLL